MLMDRLKGKRLYWGTYVRVFTDGGSPIYRRVPRFRRLSYAPHWRMHGVAVYWLGREFNFSFGKDVNRFYAN